MYIAVDEDIAVNGIENFATADKICASLKAKEKKIYEMYKTQKIAKIEFYVDCEGDWLYHSFRVETKEEKEARLKKKKLMSDRAKKAAETRNKFAIKEKQELYEKLKKELGYEK
jgi:hypothetical protein